MKQARLTVWMDPFHAHFLKMFFDKNLRKPFLQFPKDDDLEYYLSSLKIAGSTDYTPREKEEELLVMVALEFFEDEEGLYCLHKEGMFIFQRRVKLFFESEFHREIMEMEKRGKFKKDAIEFFLVKYNYPLTDTNFQRLVKLYNRWLTKRRVTNFRKKIKKKLGSLS